MADPDSETGKELLEQALRQVCDNWLRNQSQALAQSIRLCAIPLRADRQLLGILSEPAQMDAAASALQAMEFAEWDDDVLQLHPYIRNYLLSSWLELRSLDFHQANKIALTYYTQQLDQAPDFEKPTLQREVLYHALLEDEGTGLKQLRPVLDELLDRRMLDSTQEVLRALNDLSDWLTPSTRQWLRYYGILQDWSYSGGKKVALELAELQREPLPAILQLLAAGKQAELLVQDRRWAEAIRMLDQGRDALLSKDETREAARFTLDLGRAYVSLADHSGGYRPVQSAPQSRLQRAIEIITGFPFLLYVWLARRVSFLGTPLSQSTDYQDWIVAYLLVLAARYFRQARYEFDQLGDRRSAVEARLAVARLEVIKGGWLRAAKDYHTILEEDYVRFSPYRLARVHLGLGNLAYLQGYYIQASQMLEQARQVFVRSMDNALLIEADDLIGRAALRQGKVNQAVEAFLEALDTSERYGDLLSATRVSWSLEDLFRQEEATQFKALTERDSRRVQERLATVVHRVYLTRFPDHLLRRFRQIALLGALPLSFPLIALLGIILTFTLVSISESLVRFIVSGAVHLRWSDYLELFLGAALPGPAMIWLYRLVYTLLGAFYVRRLGRALDPIQGEQPDVIETTPVKISKYRPGKTREETLNWEMVSEVRTVSYTLWRKPIRLISSFFPLASTGWIALQGITDGYDHLWEDVRRWLPTGARRLSLDFSFLYSKWVGVAGLASLLAALLFNQVFGTVAITAQPTNGSVVSLGFSSWLLRYLLFLLFIMPGVIMWRLLLHRVRLRQWLPEIDHSVPFWALALAATLSTLLGILGILLQTQLVQR